MNQFEAKEQVTEIQEEMKHLQSAIAFLAEELDRMENSKETASVMIMQGLLQPRLSLLHEVIQSKATAIERAADRADQELK